MPAPPTPPPVTSHSLSLPRLLLASLNTLTTLTIDSSLLPVPCLELSVPSPTPCSRVCWFSSTGVEVRIEGEKSTCAPMQRKRG
eukprot:1961020-Rhodomonas_salina.4